MRKKQINQLGKTTPEYVVAHAARQHKRGRRPSLAFCGEANPAKALKLAQRYIGHDMAVGRVRNAWQVTCNGKDVAQLHLDYQNQLDKVVTTTDDAVVQRLAYELALSHAVQFVMQRPALPREILSLAPVLPLEEYTCENLMSFEKIPAAVRTLSDAELNRKLSQMATVVEGLFASPEQMLDSLVQRLCEKGIEVKVIDATPTAFGEPAIIATFEVAGAHRFKIWNNESKTYHFVPPYHPSRLGKKQHCLINGDTGYYIRGSEYGITRIFSPKEARISASDALSTSWSTMKHPFYAEGTTLGIEFSSVLCTSRSAYTAIYEFLWAALNQDDTYVAVSGGFNSPYSYPTNVLNRKGLSFPTPKRQGRPDIFGTYGGFHDESRARTEVRGSEHHCAWEHEVLKAEGVLEKSLVPDWFYPEGWDKIYADEVKSF